MKEGIQVTFYILIDLVDSPCGSVGGDLKA